MIIATIKKHFFLAIISLLVGCQQQHQMKMGNTLKGMPQENGKSQTQIGLKIEDNPQQKAAEKPTSVLVYLHGLNIDTHEGDAVVEAVKKLYGDQVLIIQSTCREGSKSARLSIEEQAKQVMIEIIAKLQAIYGPCTEQDLKNIPINLFGYSQGGLVACIVTDKYKDSLNIRTITLAHAPLSGTDALENTWSNVNQFEAKAKAGLEAIGYQSSRGEKVERNVAAIFLNWPGLGKCTKSFLKGVRDMFPNSTTTARIHQCIRAGEHKMPILLLTGYLGYLGNHFDFDQCNNKEVDDFNNAYSLLTTKQEGGEHDILIPLKSQLCRTNSFTNLTSSKDDPVYPENVEIYIGKDVLHCWNLTPMLSDFQVKYGKTFFQSDESIEVFTDFLGKHNHLKNLTEGK